MTSVIGGLPVRGIDSQGSGAYGAARGSRTHKGVDYACYPGTEIQSVCPGEVTKLGFPYADKLEYRYVQVTDKDGLNHRYFYIEPTVTVGENVSRGTVLGTSQELPYRGITQHVHYEIKLGSEYLNPENQT